MKRSLSSHLGEVYSPVAASHTLLVKNSITLFFFVFCLRDAVILFIIIIFIQLKDFIKMQRIFFLPLSLILFQSPNFLPLENYLDW